MPIRKLKYHQLPAREGCDELIEYYEVTIMCLCQFISQRYIDSVLSMLPWQRIFHHAVNVIARKSMGF